jgi:hypothetical protein
MIRASTQPPSGSASDPTSGLELTPFDVADYLTDEARVTDYLDVVAELNDPDLRVAAVEDVARARAAWGLVPESLDRRA